MRRLLAVFFVSILFQLTPLHAADQGAAPSHLFVLFSYGRSVAPDRTHTFAFFAKMNSSDPNKIDEHVPISWLPVVTKPKQDPDGQPVLDREGTLQIAPVAAGRVNKKRLGWHFSMQKTIFFRRKMPGVNGIKTHGAFVVTPEQYTAAKAYRQQMMANVQRMANGEPRDPERYYYKAINQSLFVCPNDKVSGELNCFQSVLASFGVCETSGPLSGVTATDYLLAKLKERKLLGEQYLETSEEIEPLLRQVMDTEENGDFDNP